METNVGPGLDNGSVVDVSVLQFQFYGMCKDMGMYGMCNKYVPILCKCYANQISDDPVPSLVHT